jgi:adenosylmethionine-8-amino-7-oxononanoate aminotransferase
MGQVKPTGARGSSNRQRNPQVIAEESGQCVTDNGSVVRIPLPNAEPLGRLTAMTDSGSTPADEARQQAARDHLWMHFTRHSSYDQAEIPTIVRGDGAYIYDAHGRRYLDGLAGLFVTQVGHGRTELAEAAAKQASELAFFPIWSYAHPGAMDLAARIADYAPGELNRVFFTTGGGEAVESAWKLAKNYFKLTGKPTKHKVISRAIAYHGTPQGALSITGLPGMKAQFEPLVPSTFRVPNTNLYRAPVHGDDPEAFGRWAADRIAEVIEFEGPDTVAAVFLEPVQNSGGCFPPPPGYFQRVREICDEYDVLLVSDEVICAFGRLGHMFGAERYGYQPDIITCAKGLTSGYAPLGAMIATDRLFEPFAHGTESFLHGYTFGGHPVSTAVAMANLDIFEREQLNEHVRDTEGAFRTTLEKLLDLPLVGDVRGDGYFYGIELVKDKATKETFDDAESERLLRGFLSKALFEAGLYCRADDRGDPVVQLSPPLICDQTHFDEIESILRGVLVEAENHL